MRVHKHTTILLVLILLCAVLLAGPTVAAENPRIVDGSKVTFLYMITIPGQAGVTIRDVSEFIQGKHQILASLEKEMTGMKAGEEKRLELSAEQGFGTYDATKKKQVSRTELPAGAKEGDILQDRQGKPAIVAEMTDSSAVVDYNHPLAGQTLLVQFKILKVENPS